MGRPADQPRMPNDQPVGQFVERTVERFATVVDASQSQFFVRIGGIPGERERVGDSPLAYISDGGMNIPLTVAFGDRRLPVDVRIHSERPEPLDDSWLDVVEVSFRSMSTATITGGEPTGSSLVLPLVENTVYRMRYGISDMDAPEDLRQTLDRDKYILDFWPEGESEGRVITQRSKQGRYWLVSHTLNYLRQQFQKLPEAGTDPDEHERIEALADTIFAQLPELLEAILTEGDRSPAPFPQLGQSTNNPLLDRARNFRSTRAPSS